MIPIEPTDAGKAPIHRAELIDLWARDQELRLILERFGTEDVSERERLGGCFALDHGDGVEFSPGSVDVDLGKEPTATPLGFVCRKIEEQEAIVADDATWGMDAGTVLAALAEREGIDPGNFLPVGGKIGGGGWRGGLRVCCPEGIALRRQRAGVPGIDIDSGDARIPSQIDEDAGISFRVEPGAVGWIVAGCGGFTVV